MQHTTQVLIDEVSSYTCDRCGREDDADSGEGQEYIHIGFTGGFDSVFGDGCHISLDLCQNCLKETLNPWLKIGPPAY